MSQKLYFMNPGKFDLLAMTTFGVSVKQKENAIGFFGTGFKYAIAIVLRLQGSVHVESDGKEYIFKAVKETISGEEFDVVQVNGKSAGFTTRLGINWEPWQAYREFYCNCKDEDGFVDTKRCEADTIVTVDCEQLSIVNTQQTKYFISGDPSYTLDSLNIYERPSDNFFYRGVAVRGMDKAALFSYEITSSVTLSEDRLAARESELVWPMQRAIQNCKDEELCRKIMTAPITSFEGSLHFDTCWGASEAFIKVAEQLIHSGVGVRESIRNVLKNHSDGKGDWPEYHLTGVQLKMLNKAVEALRGIGIDPWQFEIKAVEGLGEGVMGHALNGVIYIAELPFNMGTKQVASTLMEEWVHNKFGCKDFDRAMQNWLFDKILSLAEQLKGEPI